MTAGRCSGQEVDATAADPLRPGNVAASRARTVGGSLAIPVGLFVAAFVARVVTALPFFSPGYPDSIYYLAIARELAAGHGFTIPFIWSFVDVGGHLPAVGTLPIASNQHWMPLASIVQVPFIWLLGPTYLASCLPFWILGGLAAPITYWLGVDAGLGRRTSVLAGLLMVVPAAAAPYLSQPDNYSLFLVLAVAALWLCLRGTRGSRVSFALGGVFVGLAMLARTDGALLGVPFIVAFASEQRSQWRGRVGAQAAGSGGASRASGASGASAAVQEPVRIGWAAALACFGLFLLVMAPWWIRDQVLFGSISPSSSSGRILWITTYDEQFSLSAVTTPATFFAQGLGPLLASRIGGLVAAIQVLAGTPFAFFLAPFALIGAWVHRHDVAFRPWLVYAITFLVFSALVFAVHLPFGMALHSGMALVPHGYLLTVVGIGAAVRWVAARRPHWEPETATRNFTAIAIVAAWLIGGLATWKLASDWTATADVRTQLMADAPSQLVADAPAQLTAAAPSQLTADAPSQLTADAPSPGPASDRLMSPDPGAYWYRWGIAGIPTPYDSLGVVEQAAARYGVRWLILEQQYLVPSLEPVLAGTVHPAWLSKPLAVVPPAPGATGPEAKLPQAALYAVCLSPGDSRCGP